MSLRPEKASTLPEGDALPPSIMNVPDTSSVVTAANDDYQDKIKKVDELIGKIEGAKRKLVELQERYKKIQEDQDAAAAAVNAADAEAGANTPVNMTTVDTNAAAGGGKKKLKRKKTHYKKFHSNTSLKRKHKTNKITHNN